MGAEPSKEEQQKRVDATHGIYTLILQEARRRGRDDFYEALKQVHNEVSSFTFKLLSIIQRSEREAAEAAGKEVKP